MMYKETQSHLWTHVSTLKSQKDRRQTEKEEVSRESKLKTMQGFSSKKNFL